MKNNYVKTISQNKAKNKVDKRNRVLALILLGLFVFWSICSVFGVLAYIENRREDNSVTVYADEVTQYSNFSGSNFMVTGSSCSRIGLPNRSGSYGLPHMVTLDFKNITSSSLDIFFDIRLQVLPDHPLSAYKGFLGDNSFSFLNNSSFTLEKDKWRGINFGFNNVLYPSDYSKYTNFTLCCLFYCSGDFTGNVSSVRFFHYFNEDGSILQNEYRNVIRYTCSNGSYVEVYFYFWPQSGLVSGSAFDMWDDRTYYLSPYIINSGGSSSEVGAIDQAYYNGFSDGESSGYSKGYEDGKLQGNSSGQDAGYNSGYNVGYSDGYNIGVSEGYNNGLSDGALQYNDYTFLGLMSAIVDAPLQAITGVLNFEILGVNLSGLFFGILTTALGIFVLRLIFG